jgi:hypothetical protein
LQNQYPDGFCRIKTQPNPASKQAKSLNPSKIESQPTDRPPRGWKKIMLKTMGASIVVER